MPLRSVPRRPFVPVPESGPPLNWRRGLFRVWLVVSAAWIMAWVIYLILQYIQGSLRTPSEFLAVTVVLFGPPVAIFILGVATRWAFLGFVVNDRPPGG